MNEKLTFFCFQLLALCKFPHFSSSVALWNMFHHSDPPSALTSNTCYKTQQLYSIACQISSTTLNTRDKSETNRFIYYYYYYWLKIFYQNGYKAAGTSASPSGHNCAWTLNMMSERDEYLLSTTSQLICRSHIYLSWLANSLRHLCPSPNLTNSIFTTVTVSASTLSFTLNSSYLIFLTFPEPSLQQEAISLVSSRNTCCCCGWKY